MEATPMRPESKSEVPATDDVEKTVRERLATIEEDKKDAKPWAEVKRRILETPRPH